MIDHEKPLHIQTSTGKPVYTGYSDGPKGSPYSSKEHIEASSIHQDQYFKHSAEAEKQAGQGNHRLSKVYQDKAAHHIKISQLHGRKSGISKAPTGSTPLMTVGMAEKLKNQPPPKKPAMSAGMAQKMGKGDVVQFPNKKPKPDSQPSTSQTPPVSNTTPKGEAVDIHEQMWRKKFPYASGSQFYSGGHNRNQAMAIGQDLRNKGIFSGVWHLNGPKTGPKSVYAVTVPDHWKKTEG